MDDAVCWACLAHAESKPLDVTQIRKKNLPPKSDHALSAYPFVLRPCISNV